MSELCKKTGGPMLTIIHRMTLFLRKD